MGIVKISDELHEAAKLMAKAMSRSINSQAEYWMRVGKLVEENPTVTYKEILEILINQASAGTMDYVSEDV
ncbi:MAG: ParD-like family protein [Gammaproteobacteria bacterium]